MIDAAVALAYGRDGVVCLRQAFDSGWVERLRAGGYLLCDSQYANEHMTRFGVVEIPAAEYLSLLEDAVEVRAQWDAIDRAPPERTTG